MKLFKAQKMCEVGFLRAMFAGLFRRCPGCLKYHINNSPSWGEDPWGDMFCVSCYYRK